MRKLLARFPLMGWLSKDKDFVVAASAIRSCAVRAYTYAKRVTDKVLGKSRDRRVEVRVVPTDRIMAGIPAFRHVAYGNDWLYGLYDIQRRIVWVGLYQDRYDVPTLKHEKGHHHLSAYGIYGHDPRFDDHFEGWRETRHATGWRAVLGITKAETVKTKHCVTVGKAGEAQYIADVVDET